MTSEEKDKYRRHAVVTDVSYRTDRDHGNVLTCWVYLDITGYGHQGFGGLCLNARTGESFANEILNLFFDDEGNDGLRLSVHEIDRCLKTMLHGRSCHALFSFGRYNDPIEGLEVDGRRMTITGFRRRVNPGVEILSPLDDTRQRLLYERDYAMQRVRECEDRVRTLESEYRDWEVP